MTSKPIEECRTVAELLEDRWGQGGRKNNPEECFCVDTAITYIYGFGDEGREARGKFISATNIAVDGGSPRVSVWQWNDAPERTHADVLAAVRRANI